MSSYTQANRPMAIQSPLGPDVLLLTGLKGHEGISELFHFELQLLVEQPKAVVFDQILGQSVTVELELPNGGKRYVNGIVSRFRQGGRDETFTHFRAEVVPKLWLLTRKVRSRIFQHLTVPEILSKVFSGLVVKIEISGTYEPRDYCTQYRESDFAFASRLMEEEGIRYYFRHSSGSHQLVVTDDALEHPDLPGQSEVSYDELDHDGEPDEMRVTSWEKSQEIRSDTFTLRDHCFELPGQGLEAQQRTLETVPVGEVTHRLRVVDQPLEIYDFPGGYAQRFDGIDPEGVPRPADLQKIFPDRERTVRIRMEMEEMLALAVDGASYCRHFAPGFAFTLTKHFDGDGRYLITRVEHEASLDGDYRSGGALPFAYRNAFRCIPAALAYRPARATAKPVISGNQTATVVAPPGEEIWCDKYGRVKVLFHWDREGKKDLTASCWIRVAQPWAGNGWGAFFWPRAGNEVVVSFEEGDPDQPLVVGSVYNAENMPYFVLPGLNVIAGIKSASVRGFAGQNFNGILFHDGKGTEHLAIHSERTLHLNAERDKEFHAGRKRHESVANVSTEMVGGIPSGGGGGGEWMKDWKDTDWTFVPGDPKPPSLGLAQSLVIGENLSGVAGLFESVVLGARMTLTVNPVGIGAVGGATPPWAKPFVGAGYGGNLTFTLGANTTIGVGGPTIAVTDGDKVEYNMRQHWPSKVVCLLIGAVVVLWEMAYAILKDSDDRITLYYSFQAALSALLFALVSIEGGYEAAKRINAGSVGLPYLADYVVPPGSAGVKFAKGVALTMGAIAVPIALGVGLGIDDKKD